MLTEIKQELKKRQKAEWRLMPYKTAELPQSKVEMNE